MSNNTCYLRVIQPDGITRKCKLVVNNSKKVLITTRLPLEYQEVDYIEASGTQWINTGIQANQDTTIDLTFNVTNTKVAQFFAGARTSSSSNSFNTLVWTNNKIFSEYNNSGNVATSFVYTFGTDCHITQSRNFVYINNELYTTHNYASFTTPGNIALFGITNNSSFDYSQSFYGKIYYTKIYNGDTLVRHFIPCYRKSDNEIGMYDIINKQFYTNAGNGTFTKGNDVN